jgi:hypothetical protein
MTIFMLLMHWPTELDIWVKIQIYNTMVYEEIDEIVIVKCYAAQL